MDFYLGDNNDNDKNYRFYPSTQYNVGVSESDFKRFKRKVTVWVAVVLVLIVVANIIFWSVMSTNAAGILVGTISEDVKNQVVETVTDEVENTLYDTVRREYNLPADYSSIGLVVAASCRDTVVTLNCSAQGSSATATGIILENSGYLLTNAHVVLYTATVSSGGFWGSTQTVTRVYSNIECVLTSAGGANSYTVPVTVVDYDEDADLALCKLNSIPNGVTLKPVTFADSSLLNMGEECAILGNANGIGISLTTGVISQTVKEFDKATWGIDADIMQTTAAVNPGNSGGPIFNVNGECIGVVCAKLSETSIEGVGFAIASNFAIEWARDQATLSLKLAEGHSLAS